LAGTVTGPTSVVPSAVVFAMMIIALFWYVNHPFLATSRKESGAIEDPAMRGTIRLWTAPGRGYKIGPSLPGQHSAFDYKLSSLWEYEPQNRRTRNRRISKWKTLSHCFQKLLLFEIPCSIFDIQDTK